MSDTDNLGKCSCRLCDIETEPLLSVFEKTETGDQILHLINECLPIIIYRTDPLSKQICRSCFKQLIALLTFKKSVLSTADKHKDLLSSRKISDGSVKLYLSCEEERATLKFSQCNVSTSTDDLSDSNICTRCNLELQECEDEHILPRGQKRPLSKCSQLGTNKFGGNDQRDQYVENSFVCHLGSNSNDCTNDSAPYSTDLEQYESDEEYSNHKRRKFEQIIEPLINFNAITEIISKDIEYRYYPLSLLDLTLNVINRQNIQDCEVFNFYEKLHEPECSYCSQGFKNSKLLALHEGTHLQVNLGKAVDIPEFWPEDSINNIIRNKWLMSRKPIINIGLNSRDDMDDSLEYEDEESLMEVDFDNEKLVDENCELNDNFQMDQELDDTNGTDEIVMFYSKPTVNGRPLSSYSKIERKAFYKSIKIGGVFKKFCTICRFCFKDNWAIEGHYFSGSCSYTCRYCGMRFNKLRHKFNDHVRIHQMQGDSLSSKIYIGKLNTVLPKIIQPEKVEEILQAKSLPTNGNDRPPSIFIRNNNVESPTLQIKHELQDGTVAKQSEDETNDKKSPNQAYFCRKCYKVFFKMDEFTVHSKDCDYNQAPTVKTVKNQKNDEVLVSPSGRPIRHCVKEIGTYKDEVYLPPDIQDSTSTQSSFKNNCLCLICNITFPTVYSRNSHMRIHKGEHIAKKSGTAPSLKAPSPSMMAHITSAGKFNSLTSSRIRKIPMTDIKKEPLEPEVEIHETDGNVNSGPLGSVSITPISKDPNRKATINPNIMQLVRNNPHLTIKTNAENTSEPFQNAFNNSAQNNGSDNGDKMYKCSSCFQCFANKSNLYFHKKNNCDGSKYPCPFCKKRFGTQSAYSSHIFYSHPE